MNQTLIIFDCDGVLVDSEPLAARVLAEAIRGLGLAMEDDEAAEVFLGCSMDMVTEIVEARLGRPLEGCFKRRFLDRLHVEMGRDLGAIAGVREAIEKIQKIAGVGGLCVASNGEAETVEVSLKAVDLMSYFSGSLFTARAAERARLINRARASAASPSTARARCAGSSSRAPARRSPPRNATRPRVTASRPGYTPTATAFTPPCWLSPWPTNSPASPGR